LWPVRLHNALFVGDYHRTSPGPAHEKSGLSEGTAPVGLYFAYSFLVSPIVLAKGGSRRLLEDCGLALVELD
jgi:hypothetical protein